MTLEEWAEIRPPDRDRVALFKWAFEMTLERHADVFEALKDM